MGQSPTKKVSSRGSLSVCLDKSSWGGRLFLCTHAAYNIENQPLNRSTSQLACVPVCPCPPSPPPRENIGTANDDPSLFPSNLVPKRGCTYDTIIVVGYVNAAKTIQPSTVLFQVYNLSPRRGWCSQLTAKHACKNACSQTCPYNSSSSSSSCSLPFGTDSTRVDSLGTWNRHQSTVVPLCPEIQARFVH